MLTLTFPQKSGRNKSIDLLRFIGLSLIILAHVGPPYALFNLRCFDVPMMLFISGLVYSGRKSDFGFTFLVQRVLRLIIPVYIFLTAYFLVSAALKYFAGIDFGITMKHVVGSYLLTEGIGYVWIIRVFLIIAVLTPGLIAFNRSIQSDVVLIMILIGISLLLTFAIRAGWGMDNMFVREFIYYAVAYSIPFIVGLRVMQSDRRKFFRFFAFVAIVAVVCGTVQVMGGGRLLDINSLKYPPQSYFLFYGLFMSLVCYFICCCTRIRDKVPALFQFIGMNTIWIYLYHIPLIQLTGRLTIPWWMRYCTVYLLAVVLCYVQVMLVERLRMRHDRAIFKYLKG